MSHYLTNGLKYLHECFLNENFDIRFVGGCCRDSYLGLVPKDIDLCTNANPDQQKTIYEKYGVRHIDTGLAHGTWTVVLDDITYEITSLRTETDHDGRWAKVEYVSSWLLDASRRDFSINSMSMDFDGNIYDPYNGMADLDKGDVRFIGNANKRIQEDYLRIIRFYRFYARFGKVPPSSDTIDALINNASGLLNISRERVWTEFKQILVHPKAYQILCLMNKHKIFPNISLRDDVAISYVEHFKQFTNNPVVLLAMFTGGSMSFKSPGFDYICNDWKLSNEEANLGKFVLHNWLTFSVQKAKELLTENVNRKHIFETMKVAQIYYPEIESWVVPVFPITGDMLISKFGGPGPAIGKELKRLRQIWYENDFFDESVLKGNVI